MPKRGHEETPYAKGRNPWMSGQTVMEEPVPAVLVAGMDGKPGCGQCNLVVTPHKKIRGQVAIHLERIDFQGLAQYSDPGALAAQQNRRGKTGGGPRFGLHFGLSGAVRCSAAGHRSFTGS